MLMPRHIDIKHPPDLMMSCVELSFDDDDMFYAKDNKM